MRIVSAEMTERWKAQAKLADQRPMCRATIQIANLHRFDYDTAWAAGGDFDYDRHRKGVFTSMIFGDRSGLREIRNIRTCSWERSVDQDVATCTLTLANTDLVPIGSTQEDYELGVKVANDAVDMPGFFTYNRGQQRISANRWGYDTDTGWQDVYVPDRLVKTYEGYGYDMSVSPENDPNLVQTGTWIIDKVTYTDEGEITLEMRDLGRLLLQQIVFPPVIPGAEYPLSFSTIKEAQVPHRDCVGGDWSGDDLTKLGKATSSNDKYVGKGLTNPPMPNYVGPNGGVQGHHSTHAMAQDEGEWWMSTGQQTRNSKVWWQVNLDNSLASIGAVRLNVKGGPYRFYVSVQNAAGDWVGKRKIPYEVTTGDIDIKAGVKFVASGIADRSGSQDVIFKRVYHNVKAIRITFTHLEDSGVGKYPWQAGLRFMRFYSGKNAGSLSFEKGTVKKVVGNYKDYSDIVKWVCAWGGFFWPPHSTGMDFVRIGRQEDPEDSRFRTITYDTADPALPRGRVWGDFMKSGTAGVADLTVDMFDKKPLMDIINYVRDLLGFIFLIDETGGVTWRMPNLWSLGNYLSPTELGVPTRTRTDTILDLDEKETLLSWSTVLNSENIRERIFVANVTGKIGTVVKGYNPYPVGLRRIAGWTDQNFESKQDVRVMADMLNARSMFEYRRGTAQIPGYPGIQIDDQVRILERVTNETYYHYVLGIKSEMDIQAGEWTYDLDTHWLGERPSDAWVVKVDQLDGATQNYLNVLGG